jgi:DNA-directed RNA polymerase subunit H (RpoH/RPB5)
MLLSKFDKNELLTYALLYGIWDYYKDFHPYSEIMKKEIEKETERISKKIAIYNLERYKINRQQFPYIKYLNNILDEITEKFKDVVITKNILESYTHFILEHIWELEKKYGSDIENCKSEMMLDTLIKYMGNSLIYEEVDLAEELTDFYITKLL